MNIFRHIQTSMINFPEQLAFVQAQLQVIQTMQVFKCTNRTFEQ